MGSQTEVLGDILSYISQYDLKHQHPYKGIFNARKKNKPFQELKIWLNATAEGNNEILQLYSDYFMEANDLYTQTFISEIIAAHLKILLSFEEYYPEFDDEF